MVPLGGNNFLYRMCSDTGGEYLHTCSAQALATYLLLVSSPITNVFMIFCFRHSVPFLTSKFIFKLGHCHQLMMHLSFFFLFECSFSLSMKYFIMIFSYRCLHMSHIQVLSIISRWSTCMLGRYLLHWWQSNILRLNLFNSVWSMSIQLMMNHGRYYFGCKWNDGIEIGLIMDWCNLFLLSSWLHCCTYKFSWSILPVLHGHTNIHRH